MSWRITTPRIFKKNAWQAIIMV